MKLLKLVNLIALLCAVFWLGRSLSWGPAITSLLVLATLIRLELGSTNQDVIDADRQLLHGLLKILPFDGSMDFISKHDMGGAFDINQLDGLREFYRDWNNVARQFHDKKLEKMRKKLHESIEKYLEKIGHNIFTTDREGLFSVPREWSKTKPELFKSAVNELHDLADKTVRAHEDLIKTARKKLKV